MGETAVFALGTTILNIKHAWNALLCSKCAIGRSCLYGIVSVDEGSSIFGRERPRRYKMTRKMGGMEQRTRTTMDAPTAVACRDKGISIDPRNIRIALWIVLRLRGHDKAVEDQSMA
jgi:hypothetical protein